MDGGNTAVDKHSHTRVRVLRRGNNTLRRRHTFDDLRALARIFKERIEARRGKRALPAAEIQDQSVLHAAEKPPQVQGRLHIHEMPVVQERPQVQARARHAYGKMPVLQIYIRNKHKIIARRRRFLTMSAYFLNLFLPNSIFLLHK